MFRATVVAVTSSCLLLAPGCSFFAGSLDSVTIEPTEPEADILVDGRFMGTGTITVPLRKDRSHSIVARSGDRTGSARVSNEISTTGILDIVGGCFFLIPFLGIAAPGFWRLETDYVNVVLPPRPRFIVPLNPTL